MANVRVTFCLKASGYGEHVALVKPDFESFLAVAANKFKISRKNAQSTRLFLVDAGEGGDIELPMELLPSTQVWDRVRNGARVCISPSGADPVPGRWDPFQGADIRVELQTSSSGAEPAAAEKKHGPRDKTKLRCPLLSPEQALLRLD